MRLQFFVPAALLLLRAAVAVSQPTPSTAPSDGLELLQRIAQHYADARTYALAATQEVVFSGDFNRSWQKTVAAAAEAPGGRYYFEGRGLMGGAIRISDGKTTWKYHIDENHYTANPVSSEKPRGPVPRSEMALMTAENLKNSLASLARTLHSASLYPEETLTIDGKPVRCLVVRIRDWDENRALPNAQMEKTIWIDKQRETVVKTVERYDRAHVNGPASAPQSDVTTTTYAKADLGTEVPDAVFKFEPPTGAVLISDFPDPMESLVQPSMAGDTVPSLKFKSADGKTVAIESFRGKPLLIDFWATWCGPCVASMPKLAEIYKEARDKGLVLISIDQDEEASKAADFLAKKGYTWPNYHDGDGEIEKLMGSSGIPRTVLVDAKGQIVYDGSGGDENRLRAHLAQLGPEFKDLAPKAPQPAPCLASK